jgi:hypothetical protein
MSARLGRKARTHLRVGIALALARLQITSVRIIWNAATFATSVLLCAALLVSAHPALADFAQQGSKLIGNGAVGNASQGWSVSVSADGNTAIVGGRTDNGSAGAAWVYTRSGGVWSQQGSKLVGTGAVGNAIQGFSVALSADGNTAIVGGTGDNSDAGAAWVFTRSGGVWTQQGSKLVGTGAVGKPRQGISVSLSADGNSAIVGGYADNDFAGAAWVFTRSGGVWTQQGSKLVGTGAVGLAVQGFSVSLSADGDTAIVGGKWDNSDAGAAWVFTRSGGAWSQQGSKLVGTGAVGDAGQGASVALSADGNTALIGGPLDNTGINGSAGAAWVFTRSGGVWTQQGSKLVGTGAVGDDQQGAQQGSSVSLSADGNTAIVGGPFDNNFAGAAWVFTRSGEVWTQQGSKLVGTGAVGGASQGRSVALSGDGNTAIVGGDTDNSAVGAAWVFVQPLATATHDFDFDGRSDIAWRHDSGAAALWLMNGAEVTGTASWSGVPNSWRIIAQRDFNGDGKHDWLWRHDDSGTYAIWFMNGTQGPLSQIVGQVTGGWSVVGTGDFNGDGRGDILWRHPSGQVAVWLMDGAQVALSRDFGHVPSHWSVAETGDFNGDGQRDILWRNLVDGQVAIWFLHDAQVLVAIPIATVTTDWSIVGSGDFDGDGNWDILWRHSGGDVAVWLMDSGLKDSAVLGSVPINWSIDETGDFNGDGKSDILWRNTTSSDVGIWFMNGRQVSSTAGIFGLPNTWTVQGLHSD